MERPAIQDICPLTPMQAGLLFHALYDADSEAYFVQMDFRVLGDLRLDGFEAGWEWLCRRHAVLRSVFMYEGLSHPVQVILKERRPAIAFADLSELAEARRREHLERYKEDDRTRGFQLQHEPPMRFGVFRWSPSVHIIVWSYHHILLDGWCLDILQREFTEVYAALSQGRAPDLPPTLPYATYIRWLEGQDRDDARRYWRRYLSGYQGLATIPRLGGPSPPPSVPWGEITSEIDDATSAAMRGLAARVGVTINTLIQTLWGLILSRYNRSPDVVFGAVVSGRSPELDGLETLVGLCINAIPVRIRLRPDQVFEDVLRAVQDAALEAQPYHHLPLVEIQAQKPTPGEMFDHLLSFENYPIASETIEGDPSGATLRIEGLGAHDRTHYDFTLIVTPYERIHLRFSFNPRVYPEDQVRRTEGHLREAIRGVLGRPGCLVGQVDILPPEERDRLLRDFNDTAVTYPREPGLVGRFERQVEEAPDSPAVIASDRRLSYRDLNERANRLAHHLREGCRVRPDDRVGLLLGRSEQVPVAIWGILKAGAAYVPIDPDYPTERIHHMLTDSGCRWVVTEQEHLRHPAFPPAIAAIDVRHLPAGRADNPAPLAGAHNLAYVIYTSGSTGVPKGCQIELGNLLHYLRWANDLYFADGEGGHFGLYSSLSFDLTVTSLFLPLLRGKTLRVFPADAELLDILAESFGPGRPVDSIKLTPSHISLLKHLDLPGTDIRLAIVGGEALSLEQIRILRRLNPRMEVYNEYGPTETTVGCVVWRFEDSAERVLIGKPVANTQIYVLDGDQCVPIGVPGEIFIGGDGVGRGYLNRDDLNPRAFVPSPFDDRRRLYRAGDLGRWLPDGNLEYLGRNDDQVKVRGVRIELGEVERKLEEHPAVHAAAVACRAGQDRDKELIAYVVCATEPDARALREHLKRSLPEAAIPSFFVRIEQLPLTPNGKVDRKALPDFRAEGARGDRPRTPPRDSLEERLLGIWREVLDVAEIGVHDSFFDLGGHSLKAMQVASRVYKTLGVKVGLRAFFEAPTIAGLAALVTRSESGAFSGIRPAPLRADYELSHAQKRLWLLHALGGGVAYNMPKVIRFTAAPGQAPLDVGALGEALATLGRRHEALRTAFIEVDGAPRQRIIPDLPIVLGEIHLDGADAEERARSIVDARAIEPFDLTQPPLLRATLIRLADGDYVFLLVMHHIVGDGWSLFVLYRELLALYEAYRTGRPIPLPPLRIQYKDFAAWQNTHDFRREERYWTGRLAGVPQAVRLPYDFPPAADRDFRGDIQELTLSGPTTRALRRIAAERRTTLADVVFAVFDLFLFRWTKQEDLCVGMGVAGRNHPDLENLIGFFVNMLPIRVHLSADLAFEDLLARVSEATREALDHQDYPFDRLIETINPDRVSNYQSLINVIFAFQNYEDVQIDVGLGSDKSLFGDLLETVKGFDVSFKTSKFDLTLFVSDLGETLHMTLEYDTGLFQAETIRGGLRTLGRFADMLATRLITEGSTP
jgi:amino acid adenylation domain-containing protein